MHERIKEKLNEPDKEEKTEQHPEAVFKGEFKIFQDKASGEVQMVISDGRQPRASSSGQSLEESAKDLAESIIINLKRTVISEE